LDASCSPRNEKMPRFMLAATRSYSLLFTDFNGPNVAGYRLKQKGWLLTMIADFVRN
jgi:hypothetical protein